MTLRAQIFEHVLATAGVPPILLSPNAQGTSGREAFRQFIASSVEPLAALIVAELRVKLDEPELSFNLSELARADVASRARAASQLAGIGMDLERAIKLAGL